MNSPKPDIKKFNLRLPVDLMEAAQEQADAMGISLNAYCLLAIRNFIDYTARGSARITPKQRQSVSRMAAEPTVRQAAAPPSVRVGRNDPCPCGSGRKAKHCHPEAC
jgi:uncharacterized protein YecA (UPF0149 family)